MHDSEYNFKSDCRQERRFHYGKRNVSDTRAKRKQKKYEFEKEKEMKSQFEWNRMMEQRLYSPYKVGDDSWEKIHVAQKRFNESEFWHDTHALEELKKCFGKATENMVLTPPVYFDHGDRVFFGEHFYANTDLTILDENNVIFGDNVFLAPHVSIYTAGHPIDAETRNTEVEYAKPVTIGSDVWIGGNVVINPGVTIGSDVVIGSGSVVTKDIPDHVIAAGNPCKVIRMITDKERNYWKEEYKKYIAECIEV